MNKLTTLLAGVALAAVVAAPASAQNSFANVGTALPTFSFGPGNGSYSLTNAPVSYLVMGAADSTGTLSLTGTGLIAGTQYQYTTTTLVYTPTTGTGFTETGASVVSLSSFDNSVTFGALGTAGFSGGGHTGDRLNLSYVAPVPEAGTVVSFGALLALGGLAVLRRKSAVRAS